jgi:hypothetical protein
MWTCLGSILQVKFSYITTLSLSRLYGVGDRMINEYGVRIGRGHRITQRKPAPVPLGLPQIIPHGLTWAGSTIYVTV